MTFIEFDRIRITGRIISEPGKPLVTNMEGTVATVSEAEIKIWPATTLYDGKLWFVIAESQIELIERQDAECQ